jgi:hypothetical protein
MPVSFATDLRGLQEDRGALLEGLKNARKPRSCWQMMVTSHAGGPKEWDRTGASPGPKPCPSKPSACLLQPEEVPSIRVSTDG